MHDEPHRLGCRGAVSHPGRPWRIESGYHRGDSISPVDLTARLNVALDGRYRVERQIGEGGMATVYLAGDLRHNRHVALKVLKPELAAVIGTERFLAEIHTTASLQHPHILPLHDSGEAGGLLFYTMPFVEGDTLRLRLDREGRLPVDAAVRIVTDVAEALQVAHERGVIHRDIKPSNILMSRGKALVADFGIALLASAADATRLTQGGTAIGTAGYMSPEQASGHPGVDHRADIYSLGCLLFEMLAGEPPYGGRTILEVLMKQATGEVPSLRGRGRDVPVALDHAVAKSLAREPAQRFETATAFAAALAVRRDEPRTDPALPRTIVVLPFVNRSAEPDSEYFSDGLTDEVISDLSRVSALRVISRNSAMTLKGTTKDTPTLARELRATHVIAGTVRRAGASLRITVELIDASTDTPIWSEKFSGSMDDVFGIQEDISRQIVAALEVRLTATEARGVAERPIEDPMAYDWYLRACHLMYNWTPEAQQRAVRLVDEALAISGDIPLLLSLKGQLHWNRVNIPVEAPDAKSSARAFERQEQALTQAAAFVNRALALDPGCYLAIFVRGLVAATRGQPETGLVDLYRVHTLHAGDANVLVEFCRYSLAAGLDTRKYIDRLAAIDPLSAQSHLILAMYYGLYGPREQAVRPAYRSQELAPDASWLQVSSAWWIAAAGEPTEAAAILDRVHSAVPFDLRGTFAGFLACALRGDVQGARHLATIEMEQMLSNEYLCYMMAGAYGLLDLTDDAVRLLRKAARLGFINYRHLTGDAACLQSLRANPEFQLLLAEIKPRWEAVVEWERSLDEAGSRPGAPPIRQQA
jgi:eukaryotic-like serine/threonine-protein kinase